MVTGMIVDLNASICIDYNYTTNSEWILPTIQLLMQDKSVRITHNMSIFGGGALVLSLIIGLFGINLDGIPGVHKAPYAFGVFAALLILLGATLIGGGVLYFGLKRPITEEQVAVRKMELQRVVKEFEKQAENHAKLRNSNSKSIKFQENDGFISDLFIL